MFVTQLWAVQSYPIEKEVCGVTLDTSEDVLYLRKKIVWLPQNEKQIHRLDDKPQICPSVMTLTMTLTLNFQGQILNFLYIYQKKMGQVPQNKKQTYPKNARPQMWPFILA